MKGRECIEVKWAGVEWGGGWGRGARQERKKKTPPKMVGENKKMDGDMDYREGQAVQIGGDDRTCTGT